mmetsp:Transcript_27349/g.43270  ORF Transcript_27349/g.43270 Transcript_27349/m.43270 type:complete len:318 (-) Transcript_27349:1706-2659(-)
MSAAARSRMARHCVQIIDRFGFRRRLVDDIRRQIQLSDGTLHESGDLLASSKAAHSQNLKPLQMDDHDLWKRPQIELLVGFLVFLALRAIPQIVFAQRLLRHIRVDAVIQRQLLIASLLRFGRLLFLPFAVLAIHHHFVDHALNLGVCVGVPLDHDIDILGSYRFLKRHTVNRYDFRRRFARIERVMSVRHQSQIIRQTLKNLIPFSFIRIELLLCRSNILDIFFLFVVVFLLLLFVFLFVFAVCFWLFVLFFFHPFQFDEGRRRRQSLGSHPGEQPLVHYLVHFASTMYIEEGDNKRHSKQRSARSAEPTVFVQRL